MKYSINTLKQSKIYAAVKKSYCPCFNLGFLLLSLFSAFIKIFAGFNVTLFL